MVRQGLFLQFLLDLQYFFINTRLYYTHGLKYGLQEEFQYCAGFSLNVSQYRTVAFISLFFFFFFPWFEGFCQLEMEKLLKCFKGGCMVKANLILNFCKLEILKNVFCISE